MKFGFWRRDWFLALIVVIIFLVLAQSGLIQSLERSAYDLGVSWSDRSPGDKVAVIAIDDESISNLGRWPWPRDRLAGMIEELAAGGADVIGNTILLSEPQIDPGLKHLNDLVDLYREWNFGNYSLPGMNRLEQRLLEARRDLNTDAQLAASMAAAGNVVLGMQFNLSRSGVVLSRPETTLSETITRNKVTSVDAVGGTADGSPWPAESATPPIPQLAEEAAAIGHMNTWWDVDGAVRSELLLVDYNGNYYPSLALQIAAESLNLKPGDIRLRPGEAVELGNLEILTDPVSRMYPFFYQGTADQPAFTVDSFYDVAEGKIPVEKYNNKIVLLGATAFGVGTPFQTPIAEGMPPVMVLANVVASILNQDFFIQPPWADTASLGAFALVALFLILALPRLPAGLAALASFALLLALFGSSQYLLIQETMWVQLMWPAALLACGYLVLISKRFLVTEWGKRRSDESSAESNRMLGLAFQQQGQLDMAFEKFRKCPLDEEVMEPLYNLALDYERKRQFNKAASVYEYIAKGDAKYKDIQDRRKRSRNMQDTFVSGAGGGPSGTLMMHTDGMSKPMLGRYEVEKELGKGAMGVVYQGRDPKINRVVAIKTLALSEEFEGDELEEAKSRFFREAETAGRLTHPNIVTIYDAGEEHDLAYIAMEYLKGKDMMRYTKPENLLGTHKVLEIVAAAAAALDYAHTNQVVHRDIKPANIMFRGDDSLAIADFGISKRLNNKNNLTTIGKVLGTPHYMSPEQGQGYEIDSRSDIYSAGIMFYELLMKKKPFRADTPASLIYQHIHADLPALDEDLARFQPVIHKCLAKKPADRYQKAEELIQELEALEMTAA